MQIDDDIEQCVQVLQTGGTILYPTDTVWGIGCDAHNQEAVDSIYRIKQRNSNKSMIILLADESAIPMYTGQQQLMVYDYLKGISKPITVIYSNARNLAPNLINSDGSIGIRIVKDPFCVRLIQAFGGPIVSTSSNYSGYPPPAFFEDIETAIKKEVNYIVQHRQTDTEPGVPSTVLRMLEDGSYSIIRP